MPSQIDSKAKRNRLAKRSEPYWHKLILGGFLGYRVGSKGGTWIARHRSEEGGQHYKSLNLSPHLPQNEFDTAANEANKWFDGISKGNRAKPGTLQEAVDNYIEYLEHKKSDRSVRDAKGRVKLHILPKLGAESSLEKLKAQQIRKWHQSFLVTGSDEEVRKSRATANRNLSSLKALLNLAFKEGLVQSNKAWTHVGKYSDTQSARQDYLNAAQVKALLNVCDGHFKTLITAAALTGARYGELAKLKAKHFDKHHGLLHIPLAKTKERDFPLASKAMAFFKDQTKGKLPEAFIFTKNGIDPWGHDNQTKLMRNAVTNADLPRSVVFYTLRHSFIADLIDKDMSVFNIAKITGTSIEMIEQHYGKLFKDRVIEVLEKASLV
jgi:integrase